MRAARTDVTGLRKMADRQEAIRSAFERFRGTSDHFAFDDAPGRRPQNKGERVKYQRVCKFALSCGRCMQAHGELFDIPQGLYHSRCHCDDMPVAPGQYGYGFPRLDAIWRELPPAERVRAVGKYNSQLLDAGIVEPRQVMQPNRVRTFFEVSRDLKPGQVARALDARGRRYWRGLRERVIEPTYKRIRGVAGKLAAEPDTAQIVRGVFEAAGVKPSIIRDVFQLQRTLSGAELRRILRAENFEAELKKYREAG